MASLHRENTWYNIVLSKRYQQRNSKTIEIYLGGEVYSVTPDEAIEKLKELGVVISRKTLYNWEKEGLIPEATFRNSRTTDLPESVIPEAFACDSLKNSVYRVRNKDVKIVRELAYKLYSTPHDWGGPRWLKDTHIIWVCNAEKIKRGIAPDQPVKVTFNWLVNGELADTGEQLLELVSVCVEEAEEDMLSVVLSLSDEMTERIKKQPR